MIGARRLGEDDAGEHNCRTHQLEHTQLLAQPQPRHNEGKDDLGRRDNSPGRRLEATQCSEREQKRQERAHHDEPRERHPERHDHGLEAPRQRYRPEKDRGVDPPPPAQWCPEQGGEAARPERHGQRRGCGHLAFADKEIDREGHCGRQRHDDTQAVKRARPDLRHDREPHEHAADGNPEAWADLLLEEKERDEGNDEHSEVLEEECDSHRQQLDRERIRRLQQCDPHDTEDRHDPDLAPRQAECCAVREQQDRPRDDERAERAELGDLRGIEPVVEHNLCHAAIRAEQKGREQPKYVAHPRLAARAGAVHRVRLDCRDLVGSQRFEVERGNVVLELGDARGANEGRRHLGHPQYPRERELREALAPSIRNRGEGAGPLKVRVVDRVRGDPAALGGARVGRDAREIAVGEQALGERREDNAADAQLVQHGEQAVLDVTVKHVVTGLMNQQRNLVLGQCRVRRASLLGGVVRHANVERLARVDRARQRAHGLLDGGVRVGAVGVEDVEVLEPGAGQALVEGGEEVLARAPLAVGAFPHVVPGLRRDDQLVAVGPEILPHDRAEVALRRARRRPVVVGDVNVGHAEVKRATDDGALGLEGPVVPEVVPESQRDARQAQSAPPHPGVLGVVVTVFGSGVGHPPSLRLRSDTLRCRGRDISSPRDAPAAGYSPLCDTRIPWASARAQTLLIGPSGGFPARVP